MTTVVLYSGGMDSYIASALMKPDVNLYVDLNEHYGAKQRKVIQKIKPANFQEIVGPDLSFFIAEDKVYMPNRNVLMITLAQLFGDDIVLSATAGAIHPDKDELFAFRMGDMLSYVHKRPVRILRPFGALTKYHIVQAFLQAGGDINELDQTTSCYDPDEHECGRCRSCLRRIVALGMHGHREDKVAARKETINMMLRSGEWSANDTENMLAADYMQRF